MRVLEVLTHRRVLWLLFVTMGLLFAAMLVLTAMEALRVTSAQAAALPTVQLQPGDSVEVVCQAAPGRKVATFLDRTYAPDGKSATILVRCNTGALLNAPTPTPLVLHLNR